MQSNLEKFLVLFNRLRKEVKNTPKNLSWLPVQKPQLVELCYELDKCSAAIQRLLALQTSKHVIVPSIFLNDWNEYSESYQGLVAKAALPEKQRYERELDQLLAKAEEQARLEGKTSEEFWKDFTNHIQTEVGSTFNPIEDDAAALVGEIFDTTHDIVANDLMPDVFTDKHVGAFKYFYQTIGVDLRAISARWTATPHLFIPKDALMKNIKPLVSMYNEAVRCYTFGLNVAAVAMCRALLEHILIEHYRVPKKKALVKIIALAQERYEKLRNLNLGKLREAGNQVMHDYEKGTPTEEKTVVEFLLTLRSLIQNIPTAQAPRTYD